MKAIGGQPVTPWAACAVTRDGTLVIASASGSQLASYAWGAANVIFVVGVQKLVPTLEAAHRRIYQHSLPLEDIAHRPPTGGTARSGDPRDPSGTARPHPRRPYPPEGRLLNRRASRTRPATRRWP
jgi:hypothetical protein